MSIIYLLIPIAILLTAIGIYLFIWAVKNEQFDDLEKQGLSILFDEKDTTPRKNAQLKAKVKDHHIDSQFQQQHELNNSQSTIKVPDAINKE